MFGLFSDTPSFLTETKLQGAIHDIVAHAEFTLVIVSPYVEPGATFVRELERKARQFAEANAKRSKEEREADPEGDNDDVSLVFRADKLSEYRATEWFRRLDAAGVFLATIERLHSKLYVNHEEALVTSVNFTSGSWANSYDSGVLVPKDSGMFDEIWDYLDKLRADLVPVTEAGEKRSSRPRRHRSGPRGSRKEQSGDEKGFCIVCGKAHAFDLAKPMHYACWQAKEQPRFCHGCGSKSLVSAKAPLCESC